MARKNKKKNITEEDVLRKRLEKLEQNYKKKVFLESNSQTKNLGFSEDLKQNHFENTIPESQLQGQELLPDSKSLPRQEPQLPSSESLPRQEPQLLSSESLPRQEPQLPNFEQLQNLPKIPLKISKRIKRPLNTKENSKMGINDIRPTEIEVIECIENIKKMKEEISKVLVGQEDIVNALILGLLCDGHVLLEGVPGIAKTLAIRALGAVSGCDVKRIQFTVDLLPTDIIGITSYTPQKGFEIIKGPVFANFLIADEINRSPPKTQSALMESMQERQATIGKKTYSLPSPFFVMATENPLENAGVYPLPEAQIDRFLFKIIMGYPNETEEGEIMETNITLNKFEDFKLKNVITSNDIINMQKVVKKVYLDKTIKNYIISIIQKSRNKQFKDSEYLTFGVSPRASIGIFIASKAQALMNKRNFVIPEDVRAVVYSVLRHRLILSYKATLKKVSPDDLIKNILNEIEVR